jgi:hypothetical protein
MAILHRDSDHGTNHPLRVLEMETGPGGKQIQLDDPGNRIELFEPSAVARSG